MVPDPNWSSSLLLRFHPFELEPENTLLRRGGVAVDLPPQALRILVILVARPSELVTRQEIKQALWPGESHGDLDSRLNFSVKKLREALGDSAEQPRYVQTVRNAGYIFIAPVRSEIAGNGNGKAAGSRAEHTGIELDREVGGAGVRGFRLLAGCLSSCWPVQRWRS